MIHTLLLLAAFVSPQSPADPAAALEAWRETHGTSWTGQLDPHTGFVQSLYGGHTAPGLHLASDGAALVRGRALATAAQPLLGIDPATLVDGRAIFLPLGSAGSTDKYAASFPQVVRGVPVVGGTVHVLMDLEGRALSLDSSAIPGAESASTTPIREAIVAARAALRAFRDIAGFAGELAGEPRLVLDRIEQANSARAALAWEVDVMGEGPGEVPRGLRLRIVDADLSTSSREELVHTCDVSGTVFTRLTPGTLPDLPTNVPVQVPMAHVVVQSPQGNATTDINGNFNIVGATAPLNVTVSYNGPFTTPTNAAAPVYSLPAALASASGNSIFMNSPVNPFYTAEANSTHWIGRLRDWTRAVNPLDATADFDALSNINLAQTCNAYFAGNSVNFFAPGGGCVNTSYSSVVAHEMGHWLNVLYGSGNGPDGFGEGNADSFAIYLTNQPIVGENFYTSGAFIRTGLNTRMFCGDLSGGCHGGVHNDGEVLMGALWKVRARLQTSLGQGPGGATADLIFNSWMNAYNDSQIKTIVRTHWLLLDDNDGDINNGTPHYTDIDGGFVAQGFPPYPIVAISLTGVTLLPNTQNEAGPYVVNATTYANLHPPLTAVELQWRANGGSLNVVPMTPLGGNQYTAAIPGHLSPTKIQYCVRSVDSQGGVAASPTGGPVTLHRFIVGEERIYFTDTFSNSFSAWPAGAVSGQSDWQFQDPAGLGGDPADPRTGTKCWGTDLGNPPMDGLYTPNLSSWVESPPINLSSCPRPILRFQRWLTVDTALNDQARVLVNGQQVWVNSSAGQTIDTGWTEVEYDLTPFAAGNPQTRIRFQLTTNGSVQLGGWNIDDVEIVMVSANGLGCVDPVVYCTSKVNSNGWTPRLVPFGAPSEALNTFGVDLLDGMPFKPGILLRSSSGANAAPFSGGLLCVLPPVVREELYTTDVFGYARIPIAITPGMPGVTWHLQAWYRDPPSSFGAGLSNGVQAKFCP